jgi:hypothetical protein
MLLLTVVVTSLVCVCGYGVSENLASLFAPKIIP